MKLIQTVNYIESKEHLREIFDLLNKTHIDGIRINLCKYNERILVEKIKIIIDYIHSNPNKYDIYFDIPFPKNKTRIISLKDCFHINKNQNYIITNSKDRYNSEKSNIIFLDTPEIIADTGLLFYGDGEGAFVLQDKKSDSITVKAVNEFDIIIGKAISCGYTYVSDYCIESILNIISSLDNNIFIMLSFVETVNKLIEIRRLISPNIKVISKIETEEAINNIDSIIDQSDGILVARGDLAINTDLAKYYQNINVIEDRTLYNKKTLIVCTDVLKTMKKRILPNRAELFDLSSIINKGASTIIFSGGDYFNFSNIKKCENDSLEMIRNKINLIQFCENKSI